MQRAPPELFLPRFDSEKCTRCGICLQKCPVIHLDLKKAKDEITRMIDSRMPSSVTEKCTGCMSCKLYCPEGCDPHALVLQCWNARYTSHGLPAMLRPTLPYSGESMYTRVIGQFPPDDLALVKSWDKLPRTSGVVLYSGCNMLLQPNLLRTRMLDGVEIFGNGRWCCGEPLFRMGLWDAERQVAEHLLQDFSQLRCKEMLVPCLAGYHLFTVVYPKLFNVQFPFDITPLFDWLGDRIMKGEITVVRPFHELKAALHDNCWPKISGNRFHASIRALLEKIGVEVIELPHAKENNLCCGMCAVAANYSITDGVKHGLARLKEAKRAGADVVIDYCGGCNWFMEVSKHFYPFKLPAVKHVMELLIEATGETCLHDNRWLGNLLFKETMKTVLPKALNRKRFYMKKIIIP